VKLLRVLQEREMERLGGTETIKINVRLIVATHRDLEKAVEEGVFRKDLYYRLNVFSIFVPPLRERRPDVVLLADHFLLKFARQHGKSIKRISTPAIDMLMSYHWPGNVRELENAIERGVVLSRDEDFTEDLLPLSVRMFAAQRRSSQASDSVETLTNRLADQAVADFEMREGEIYQLVIDQIEHALIDRALSRCGGYGERPTNGRDKRNTTNSPPKCVPPSRSKVNHYRRRLLI